MSAPGDRLELLETFIRIAETGGIGAAARSMETTQPTVSRRLQQLEALMNAKLVERNTQGLSLTAVGATLLPEAREVLQRWRGLEELAAAQGGEVAGLVRVSCATGIGDELLPDLLVAFLSERPAVRVDLRLSDGPVDVLADGIDFALRVGKVQTDGAVTREIARVRRALYAAPELAVRLADDAGVAIARCEPLALEGAPFISSAPFYGATIKFSGRGGETLEARFERVAALETDTAVRRMCLSGLGVAALPTWMAADDVAEGRLALVAGDWTADAQPISLTWAPSRFRSAAASELMDLVQEALPAVLED
ncbi:MAG: LysR family transcriptional regulator [Pseudomonadota bacterium]